ncbi:MAG: killer suppression protein HigA [Flavobacteriaceae bacterium]|nr:killer suppression protein HigA [Flavobacteriaceae bacterium]
MKIEYKKNKLKRQLSSASEIKRNFGVNAKRVSSRISDITASPNLNVLIQIPAANCHRLSGDRNGKWALNISTNHRMIFEVVHNPLPENEDGSLDTKSVTDICIIEIVDYH